MSEENDYAWLTSLNFSALVYMKKDCYRFIFRDHDQPHDDSDAEMDWQMPRLGAAMRTLQRKFEVDIRGYWFSFGQIELKAGTRFVVTITGDHEDLGCWSAEEIINAASTGEDMQSWHEITEEIISSMDAQFGHIP